MNGQKQQYAANVLWSGSSIVALGLAGLALNVLIGNAGWKGGLSSGGVHWHENGSKQGPFHLGKLYADRTKAFGVRLTREKSKYEESTLFAGYPAKRTWYPYTGNVYQEIIPSAGMGYPYSIDALFLHMGSPGYPECLNFSFNTFTLLYCMR